MECMLYLSAESFVLQFAIRKYKDKIYRNIILHVFSMGVVHTWSLTLREVNRLTVLENKVLRKILD